MIKKLLTLTLCLIVFSCGGISVGAGIKFKKSVNAVSFAGNPGFTSDGIKLSSDIAISFPRPIGECGARVTFFGIILPVIPVWLNLNSCEKSFVINISDTEVLSAKLKYNGVIHDPVTIERKSDITHSWVLYEVLTEYKFQIPNFWKFRMADDKAIIVRGKTKDGKEFTEELPVEWGIMPYKEWSFP